MAYSALIDSQLRIAYNLAKDLAKPAIFRYKESQEFDFNTGQPSFKPEEAKIVKVIVSEIKSTTERKVVSKQIMVRSKDIGKISSYSTIELEGYTWNFSDILKDDGFILLAIIYREAHGKVL